MIEFGEIENKSILKPRKRLRAQVCLSLFKKTRWRTKVASVALFKVK